MAKYLTPAQQEIRLLLNEADEISKRSEINRRDESRLSFLFAKVKSLQTGHADPSTTECRDFFSALFTNKEVRTDMQEGTQSITYSQGTEGGFTVPQEFHDEVVVGMAQLDPLLNSDVVTLIESGSGRLRPYSVPGWDLSVFKAVKVAEGVQQNPQTPPTAASKILNGFKYAASLDVSIELEEDAFVPMQSLMKTAYSIGFARGIGADLIVGDGSTGPQGVLNGATDSGLTTGSVGVITATDIENVYFSVNRFHRASPKCAWLMTDTVYQKVRKAVDDQHRPLINIVGDQELLMGKPIYVSPSMPEYNASLGTQLAGSFCAFGDLAHLFVRVSKLAIKRSWQAPGYVDLGKALYTGIMRADAKVIDPTSGSVPPIVTAKLHA